MKKYYLHTGNEQQGPFDLHELGRKNLRHDTPVWFDGLSDWTLAYNVEELRELIKRSMPPESVHKTVNPPLLLKQQLPPIPPALAASKKKKDKSELFVIGGAIVLLVIAILVYEMNENILSKSKTNSNSYQNKVTSVAEIEKANPKQFLTVSGTFNPNLFGTKVTIQGVVTNKATVANYKDVEVKIIFYSETGTEIDSKNYFIYDYFPAHSTTDFTLKVEKPDACTTIGIEVVRATGN